MPCVKLHFVAERKIDLNQKSSINEISYDKLCQNTINSLTNVCNRDKNMNNPSICNEAIILGIDESENKCYAFQSSNKCYLDHINGEQYDYFNINNIN